MAPSIKAFLQELRRRHVYQVGATYIVVGLGVLGASELVLDPLGLGAARPVIVLVALAGFPLALVTAWAYELRPAEQRSAEVPSSSGNQADVSTSGSAGFAADWEPKSIVVLPFDNMSPDPDDAYFPDGLTEELITDLSHVEALRVISRTSAMSFKGRQADVRTIADQLKVRYVLEGSVRRAGDNLRVTAQLIDTETDSHLWAEKYTGVVGDVFDLQERLSRQIVSVLKVRLSADEEVKLVARPIPDVRAYEHYLRARANIYSFDGTSIHRAIRDLNAALEILGDNALLLRALGLAHFQEINAGITEDPGVIDSIEKCGDRIAELDLEDPGSFLLRGVAHWMKGDCASAVVSLRKAYGRDRSDPDVMLFLAVTSLSTGQMDLVRNLVCELDRVDPLAHLSPALVGFHHLFEGRFAHAAEFLERALRLGPEVPIVLWTAVRTFVAAEIADRAVACATLLRQRVPDSAFSESADLFVRGLTEDSGDIPQPSTTLQTYADRDCELAQYVSDAYAFLGDGANALRFLQTATRTGFMNHAYLAEHDPFLRSFRHLSEWQVVLHQIQEDHREFETSLAPV